MTLDLTRLRTILGAVATPVDDTALEIWFDAAREAVDERLGPIGEVRQRRTGRGPLMRLGRRATGIVSVTERDVVLDSTDYELMPSGTVLRRLTTGPNGARTWCGTVDIRYTAVPDLAARESAIVALVRLDVGEASHAPDVASQSIGDWSESYVTGSDGLTAGVHQQKREDILGGLRPAAAGIW